MRKLKALNERLTSRAAERRKNRILKRKRDEERRFTELWAEERRMPEKFKQAQSAGTKLSPEAAKLPRAKRGSLLTRFASLVGLRRTA